MSIVARFWGERQMDELKQDSAAKPFSNGLWSDNPALVQLLGLCPLLAVTTSATNGLTLGLATLATLVLTNGIVAAIRHHVTSEVRLPTFVLIIASVVTGIEMLLGAWAYELYVRLGLFVPLIVTNCIILARAEAFASRNPIGQALRDGLSYGLGMAGALLLIGAARELIGSGSLFAGLDLLIGPAGQLLEWHLAPDSGGLLLALLAPGAFFTLALGVVAHQMLTADKTADTTKESGEAG